MGVGMSKKALIVDDSRTAYMVLARILTNYDIESIHAKSGDLALKYLEQNKVDVIFLDQAMPGKDGFETIKEIKQSSAVADIPVMMFTARSGENYHEEVKALGAVGVLPKELSAEEVEDALVKLNLWGAISGQTASEHIESDIMQPTADEKLRVWLESFLENEFSPQLSHKVRKATDDLRRDTIHYGKRMLDEIAKTDKQQLMLQEVKGQTDYLKQLFLTSFKQYRLISAMFIAMLILLSGGILWLIYQVSTLSEDQKTLGESLLNSSLIAEKMNVKMVDEIEAQTALIREISVQSSESSQVTSEQPQDAVFNNLYNEQGYAGKIIGINSYGNALTAKSDEGYLFVVSPQGRVMESNIEKYFMQPGCNGTAYTYTLPGIVMRMGEDELVYTDAEGETLPQVPVSWESANGQCESYQETKELMLRPLIRNDEVITGVADMTFYHSK